MTSLRRLVIGLLAIVTVADSAPTASTPNKIVSEVCTSPGAHFNSLELALASAYCSESFPAETATATGELATPLLSALHPWAYRQRLTPVATTTVSQTVTETGTTFQTLQVSTFSTLAAATVTVTAYKTLPPSTLTSTKNITPAPIESTSTDDVTASPVTVDVTAADT